jgi:hypothetical protein
LYTAFAQWDGKFREYDVWYEWIEHVEQGKSWIDMVDKALETGATADPPLSFLRDGFHDLYSYFFHRFNALWESTMLPIRHAAGPAILQFPRVFGEFKAEIEEMLLSRQLEYSMVVEWQAVGMK